MHKQFLIALASKNRVVDGVPIQIKKSTGRSVKRSTLFTLLTLPIFLLTFSGCFLNPQKPRVKLENPELWYVQIGMGHVSASGTFYPDQTVSFLPNNNEQGEYKEIEAGTYAIAYRGRNVFNNYTGWYFVGSETFSQDKHYTLTYTNGSNVANANIAVTED